MEFNSTLVEFNSTAVELVLEILKCSSFLLSEGSFFGEMTGVPKTVPLDSFGGFRIHSCKLSIATAGQPGDPFSIRRTSVQWGTISQVIISSSQPADSIKLTAYDEETNIQYN